MVSVPDATWYITGRGGGSLDFRPGGGGVIEIWSADMVMDKSVVAGLDAVYAGEGEVVVALSLV